MASCPRESKTVDKNPKVPFNIVEYKSVEFAKAVRAYAAAFNESLHFPIPMDPQAARTAAKR